MVPRGILHFISGRTWQDYLRTIPAQHHNRKDIPIKNGSPDKDVGRDVRPDSTLVTLARDGFLFQLSDRRDDVLTLAHFYYFTHSHKA